MIPFDDITQWRTQARWTQDLQVEQDMVITRTVIEMFDRPEIAKALAFRGGTALYKLHIKPAPRYSEDIDLVQVEPGSIGDTLTAVRAVLDPWLGSPKRSFNEGRVILIYRMTSEGAPAIPMRLKVEINTREHFTVFGFEERTLEMQSRWFSGAAPIRTYALDELLGTKLRALYQRKKSRDLFDLWIAGKHGSGDPARIVECFRRYLEHDGAHVSRAEFEMNLHEKYGDSVFAKDIAPLLATGVEWDTASAEEYIRREVMPLLPGEPWKGTPG
ncbi:MAG: nucleotidyl transferase AbiEii/AbiGii toxin family protein [Deltaproteobacteria bacterium]|nr:nucleotidyl transferase AbiEii/AbiGii toxin family protein [Deltaproteobacteria bacterium]